MRRNLNRPLTTGADSIVGTASNDIINGLLTDANGQQTFQTWDTIDGGAGVNTLNVQNTGANVLTPTLANIQNLNFQDQTAGGSAITLNLQGLSTLNNLSLDGSGVASGYTVTNLGSLPTISLSGMAATTTIDFTAAALQPAGQTLNLTLNGFINNTVAPPAAGGIILSDTGSNALETVSITASGSASNVGGLTTTGLGVTQLNISGNQNLTLGAITDENATLKTVNASAATGNVSLTAIASSTVTGGAGNDTITSAGGVDSFTGGAGSDTFQFAGFLTVNDTVAGGDGTADVLAANSATLALLTTAAPTVNVSGIEQITTQTAMAGETLTLSAIQAGLATVNLSTAGVGQDGTIVFDSGVAGTVFLGVATGAAAAFVTADDLTVRSAGTGTTDAVTIRNRTTGVTGGVATSMFVATTSDVIADGVETLTIDGTTTTTTITHTPDTIKLIPTGAATSTLILTGNNSFAPSGVITANAIDASALGVNPDGAQSLFTMAAVANTATTITGSAGNDTLRAHATLSSSIVGNAGNDTIIAGAGNDNIDGGAGNDTVQIATGQLTANDTISGGDGTADVLQYTSYTAADNAVAAQARVSNFEVLRLDDTTAAAVGVTLSNYVNNTGWTQIRLGTQTVNTDGYDITNAGSGLNTISIVANATAVGVPGVAGTHAFDRLVDTAADTLTVRNANPNQAAIADNSTIINGLTALDEETITLTEVATTSPGLNDMTITTLTVGDLKTLNIASASDVIITTAIVGATQLSTVDATAATGAVTVDASNSIQSVTMTGNTNSSAITTFTGSATVGSSITGGSGADNLTGGTGVDTISGGADADVITGNAGADILTGGGGADDFIQANQIGALGVLAVDTVTDFSVTQVDQIGNWSIGNLKSIALDNGDTLDLVLAGNAATSIAAGQAFVFATVSAAYDLGTDATASALLIDGNFNAATLETALEVGGTRALTANGAFAKGDGFFVVYDDGINTYIGFAETNAAVLDDAKFAAGDLTVTNLVTLSGVADATTITAANTLAFLA